MPELRRTPLTDRHEAAGARMAAFAGWRMPLEFSGTVSEHRAVRAAVGVFDVSHLGSVTVRGADAGAVVAGSFANDARSLDDGRSQYTLCCSEQGGILDDLIVYRLRADEWMAAPNAANTATVVERLVALADGRDATVEDVTDATAILAVQGPEALDLVDGLGPVGPAPALPAASTGYLGVTAVEGEDGARGLVCRTGYTGEPGCELMIPAGWAGALWDALLDAGATPAGLGARDTLRLEMGYPLHGADLTPETDPFEARLGWAVKLGDRDFVGAAALAERKREGPRRRLWGLRAGGRRPLRSGAPVLVGDRNVGELTSGSFSPTLEVGVGLGYLDDAVAVGDRVDVELRGSRTPVEVVRPPFVDRDPRGT